MATKLAASLDVKRADLVRVFPKDLIVDPKKRGREFPPTQDRVIELAEDIRVNGQRQPITVTLTPSRMLEVTAGFTRYEAVVYLNSTLPADEQRRVDCRILQDVNAEEAFLANLSENRNRNATTVIDDAHNVRRLERDFGYTDEQICTLYGTVGKAMSSAWLSQLRKLLTLSREQQFEIHTGVLQASTGYFLADLPEEKRAPVVAATKAASKTGKVTTAAIVKTARKAGATVRAKALSAGNIKEGWEFLAKSRHPNVVALSKTVLEWQADKISEDEFFQFVHKLLVK